MDKHPVLFEGKLCSPSYYVKSGAFRYNYLSYHRCIDCGTQVIFSEDAMKRHFHSNSHLQISVTPYEDYQYTLTQLDPRHMQICIDHGNGSWEDVLSMIPQETYGPIGLENQRVHRSVAVLWFEAQQLKAAAFNNVEDEEGFEDEDNDEEIEFEDNVEGDDLEEEAGGLAYHIV